ncbi:MAG: hypothetical protein Q9190_007874, partial [Brigantiaea leucoxantha]
MLSRHLNNSGREEALDRLNRRSPALEALHPPPNPSPPITEVEAPQTAVNRKDELTAQKPHHHITALTTHPRDAMATL